MQYENKIMRNKNGDMIISSEASLENEFLYRLGAGNGTEEDLSGAGPDSAEGLQAMQNTEDPLPPNQESDKVKEALTAPENQVAAVKEWTSFDVDINTNFASKLQDEQHQGLDSDDANKNSYFIKYVEPDTNKIYGIMGPMFGKDKEQGVGQSYVGGYETKEDAQQDLKKMEETWKAGFPEEKEYMLVELSQLSPDLIAYEKAKQDALPKKIKEQEEKAEESDKELTPPVEAPIEAPAETASNGNTKPTSAGPKTVTKVPAHHLDIRRKIESRLQRLKQLKG